MKDNVLVVAFYLIISLFFFRGILTSPGLIIGSDWGLPETFSQMRVCAFQGLFLWSHNMESLFGSAVNHLNDYFFRIFVGLLPAIHVNGEIFTKFLLVFLFTLAGFSMYSYCRFLRLNKFPSILAGYFFVTTPLFFNYTVMGWTFLLLSLGLLPFALITFTKSIKERKVSYAILTGILFSISFLQSQSIVWYSLTFILLSFFIVSSRQDAIFGCKSLIIVFSVFFLMHISWILPSLLYINPIISQGVSQYDIARFSLRLSDINILRLWGSLFNYQYESTFPSSMLFVTFVPTAVAYFALVLKKDRMVLFFALLSLLPFVFFGGAELFQYIPFSNVVRDVSRFIVFSNLSYSVLIAVTIEALIGRLSLGNRVSISGLKSNRYKNALLCVLIALIMINSYPFWTGELYGEPRYGYDTRLRTLEFPSEYHQVETMLAKEESSSKALFLPLGGGLDLLYDKRFHGSFNEISDIFAKFAPVPGIIHITDKPIGIAQGFAQVLQSNIYSNESSHLSDLLSSANVKYVIIRLNTTWPGQPSMKEIFAKLKQKDEFYKLYENNSIVVFENTKVLPHIYPATTSILVKGSVDEMLDVVTSGNFTGNNVLFLSNQTSKSQWEFLEEYKGVEGNYLPAITFQKINPTKYEVHVKNATFPFFLVFSESYYPGWKAYVESKPFNFNEVIAEYNNISVRETRQEMRFTPEDIFYFSKKPISEDKHFLVNGYANAWYIDPSEIDKDGNGEFTITLYFWPQSLFYIGLVISIITLIICILYISKNKIKTIYRRYIKKKLDIPWT